jgi:hypothetical protein
MILRFTTGWTVRGSNTGEGEIFRTRPYQPWGLPSLLYTGYRASFPGVERPLRDANHSHSSSTQDKEYSYNSAHPLGHHRLLQGELYLYLFLLPTFTCGGVEV